MFIGSLPGTVVDFQQTMHALFPRIADTKYLATHGQNSMHSRSNLSELLAPYKAVHVPLIVLHEAHTAYGGATNKSHEAGFDSK